MSRFLILFIYIYLQILRRYVDLKMSIKEKDVCVIVMSTIKQSFVEDILAQCTCTIMLHKIKFMFVRAHVIASTAEVRKCCPANQDLSFICIFQTRVLQLWHYVHYIAYISSKTKQNNYTLCSFFRDFLPIWPIGQYLSIALQ